MPSQVWLGKEMLTWTSQVSPITPVHQKRHIQRRSERGEHQWRCFMWRRPHSIPNDPSCSAVCGGKEPLREEPLITGTQCPEGAPQLKNTPIHQPLHSSDPVCSPLSWLHEKSPFANIPEDGWQWGRTSIRTFEHLCVRPQSYPCINTRIRTHTHTQAVTQRARLLVLPPMEWITVVVCFEDHRYV